MNDCTYIRKSRFALFFMQLFSTLGFSVLYSTLVLYSTEGLNLESDFALALTGGFIAFNYSLHVLGGYMGGRLLSYRALFIIGMLLQSLGCFILSIPNLDMLFLGTAVFLSGCGLNVVCINCMLTQLFTEQDKGRESAFLSNYSAMNVGFLIGFSVGGYFQLDKNFHSLFLFASCGSLLSFLIALLYWKYLADKETYYSQSKHRSLRSLLALTTIVGLIIALLFLLKHVRFANGLICLSGIFVALLFACTAWKSPRAEAANKIWAFLILSMSSLIFWTLYQMAPMGLTLFFNRNVQHVMFGYTISPQWMQNINTLVIILGGPLLASLNQFLRSRGYKISIPFQFTTALLLIGFGFLLLPIGIYFGDPAGYSSIGWIVGSYFLQSGGELFISPIGYAMIGQLIPSQLQGLAMGAWMMVTGVAATLSSYFSQRALGSLETIDPLVTNVSYSSTFLKLAIFCLIASLVLFFLRPFLHKLIQERSSLNPQ